MGKLEWIKLLGALYEKDELAKAWIKVKYDQIAESRTKRVTFFD